MKDSLRRRYAFFTVHYFVQGAIGITFEPLNYLLKDRLGLTAGQASGFIALMTLPLLFKPLYGFVTDFVPLGGYHRKPHLILASLVASLAFAGLAAQSHYAYLSLLLPVTIATFAMAFADAVCGGVLVEDGKERKQTGRYQALHIGALYLSVIAVGTVGGWMTSHLPFRLIFGITALLPLFIVIMSFLIHEPPRTPTPQRNTAPLWVFMRTKPFWMLGLTIVLWNFYPFLGTVQFYYQSNVLHLNPQWIGSLMSVGSVAGLIGSAAFWKFCRGRDVSSWISYAPVSMALISLSYLFYQGPVSVTVIETVFGFASVFFRLALLDLVAQICPDSAAATSYAVFLALFDLAMYGSNFFGGKLYDILQGVMAARVHHDQLSALCLVLMGAACTLACHWTLPLIRKNQQTDGPIFEGAV